MLHPRPRPTSGSRRAAGGPGAELPRVAVIGGGLAGLTTVYELVRRARTDALPLEIRLFEAEYRLGGIVGSDQREGFLLERGPDSIRTDDPAGLRLVVELGLAGELIPARCERGVLIWWADRWHPMPPGLSSLAGGGRRALYRSSLFGFGGKARAGIERLVPGRRSRSDESVASFVRRRFGRQMLERVADPLLSTTHAGDPTMLSIRHTWPRLVEMERRHGSLTKGWRRQAGGDHGDSMSFPGVPEKVTRSPLVSFRGGMQALVDAVVGAIRRLDAEALHPGRRVSRLDPAGDPAGAAAYAVELDDQETWIADICVLAVPGRAAAALLESFAPEIAVEVGAVPHASSLAVDLAYDREAAARMPEAMACLVPHSQGRPVFACTLMHRKFDHRVPPGAALLRVCMGGMRKPELLRGADETLVHIARQEAGALLGVAEQPLFAEVRRWPRAHPQYLVGHAERIEAVARHLERHAGLLIAGTALHGASIPEVVDNARATAAVVADLVRGRLA